MTHDDSILGGEKEREENLTEKILQSLFTVSCRVGSTLPMLPLSQQGCAWVSAPAQELLVQLSLVLEEVHHIPQWVYF